MFNSVIGDTQFSDGDIFLATDVSLSGGGAIDPHLVSKRSAASGESPIKRKSLFLILRRISFIDVSTILIKLELISIYYPDVINAV